MKTVHLNLPWRNTVFSAVTKTLFTVGDVAIERAANNTFTYWLTVTNVGPVTTNFEGKYAILK